MIKFITDVKGDEKPFPPATFHRTLKITDLDGNKIQTFIAPFEGWTNLTLNATTKAHADEMIDGADAYLGSDWVGSTEV